MIRVTLYAHPLAPVAQQVFEVPSLAAWLLGHYGETLTVGVQIFQGEPSLDSDISSDVAAILAGDCPAYTVLQTPGDPASWTLATWLMIGAAAVSVTAILLIPKPVMPGNINRTQSSPNNALSSRENQVRLLERVEDIYGTVKSIPSLMMPTYNKYIGHKKFEYGYYCVGRGYYALAELRDGDTLIADIAGASASVYDPFTSPNSGHAPVLQVGDAIIDNVLTVKRAIEVDGITLKALNQVQLPASASYTFTPDAGGDILTQSAKQPNINAITSVGDIVTISMAPYDASWTSPVSNVQADASGINSFNDFGTDAFTGINAGDTFTVTGFLYNNGTYVAAAKPSVNKIEVTGTLVNETSSNAVFSKPVPAVNYSGSYAVASVSDGSMRFTSVSWTEPVPETAAAVQLAGVSATTDWVTLPDTDRAEVWINITAPNGLFKDNGGKSVASVNFTLEIEKLAAVSLAPTGIVETVTGALSGSVSDERADTIEHATAWTGPARVRMTRTTDYDYGWSGTVQDEIKWADLYSVSPVTKNEFGNKTTIHTVTQATARATAVKSRQVNCIASRRLPIYNGSSYSGAFDASGRLVSGTIEATSRICDIIPAVAQDPKIGARDLYTEVDMAQIYGVQTLLNAWNPVCGQFNFTFDSDNISFEETIISIANAAFCIAYRQNGKIRLAFDRAQASSTALFTHRNKKPNAETITRKFASDAEYDGVEFVYVDPDSNQSETITLPLSGAYTKLKKFEIAGIRSFSQAWLRANREYRKLIGQRISIETTTTLDARSLLPNSRIDVVDNTRFKSFDGEVLGQAGLELTLSQGVAFAPGLPHSIVLMRRDGSLQSIPVTAGSAANKVILQSLPTEAITTQYGADGIRTIYSFAADSARGAMAWLVQEIDISDGQYCTVRAINYSASYYAADYVAIPAKASVIN
ncbi:host specificity factor TipJ family phage tail protein [Polaromonas sp. CG_23.6]|uniref:host specificity factor TipJ family phage tail protein n=1 Tax=Polaromonas sp. CG_23.6 TaxID=2760709 RepID=UPI002474E243|nr:host specificity factor TipJ family phage tail protein [Polaromonas sp. CG_23.6]MDH6185474.1 hypothetical protein [Polaromonas sp. CG_23.6]